MKNNRFAFTLIELILVASMIGIISIIGVTNYSKSKNKALSREAIANLKLIAAAERIYKMEDNFNSYVACVDADECNTKLKLNLNTTNWTYNVILVSGNAEARAVNTTIGTYIHCSSNFDA
ncbi:MAG: hypothetical protein WC394_05555 [Candidatus Omnitrophota bacterium]|jgi:type II secretory pathway pseudopilin PulG